MTQRVSGMLNVLFLYLGSGYAGVSTLPKFIELSPYAYFVLFCISAICERK